MSGLDDVPVCETFWDFIEARAHWEPTVRF